MAMLALVLYVVYLALGIAATLLAQIAMWTSWRIVSASDASCPASADAEPNRTLPAETRARVPSDAGPLSART